MNCDALARDRIEGRDDRNDVDSGRLNAESDVGVGTRSNVRATGVNICTSGVVVVGRSKRDKGGIRGILSVSICCYAYLCLLT
jgi:hypothetical protein